MGKGRLKRLQNKYWVDSMNRIPESAKALIEALEQVTGTPYKGIGINTAIHNLKHSSSSSSLLAADGATGRNDNKYRK